MNRRMKCLEHNYCVLTTPSTGFKSTIRNKRNPNKKNDLFFAQTIWGLFVYSIKANWKEISFATLSAVVTCAHICFQHMTATRHQEHVVENRKKRTSIATIKSPNKNLKEKKWKHWRNSITAPLCSRHVLLLVMSIYFAHLWNALFQAFHQNSYKLSFFLFFPFFSSLFELFLSTISFFLLLPLLLILLVYCVCV